VVVTARRLDRLLDLEARIQREGGVALALRLDVSRDEDFPRVFRAAKLKFGRVDAVLANAGTALPGLAPDEEAVGLMDINYFGVRRALTHALKLFREDKKGGVFLATSSILAACRRGENAFPDYCASKAAVDALVRSCGSFAAEGIRAHAINPGPFGTELLEAALHQLQARGAPISSPDEFASFCPLFPGFCPPPDPIGVLVRRLIADDNPSFPPGSCVGICGPAVFSMHELLKDLERGGPDNVDLTALYDPDLNPAPLTKEKQAAIVAAYKADREAKQEAARREEEEEARREAAEEEEVRREVAGREETKNEEAKKEAAKKEAAKREEINQEKVHTKEAAK